METTLANPTSVATAVQTMVDAATAAAAAEPPGITLPVTNIVRGNNPRTHFCPVAHVELTESVKAQGILQPILVRPLGDGVYQIVAGERRYRAQVAAFGNVETNRIPVLIREMTDEEANAAALTENINRDPMTAVDEAEGAARVLADHSGNRDRAAEFLGWKRPFLDRRLALMNAIPPVRLALKERKIDTGHAELIAALRAEVQEKALQLVTGAIKRLTVSELKVQLQQLALSLTAAIFDTAGCAGCQYSTVQQAAMFAEALSEGHCTNGTCYKEKTEAELESRAQALRDDFQVVKIVRAGDNYAINKLVADGPKGVGEQQATACRSCKNFGAVVSGLPNSLGKAYKDQCMDSVCNVKMIAANQAALAAIEKATTAAAATATSSSGPSGQAKKSEPSKGKPTSKPSSTKDVEPSNAVRTYREGVWRSIFKTVVEKSDPVTNRSVMLALALHRPSTITTSTLEGSLKSLGLGDKSTSRLGDRLAAVLDLEQQQLAAALSYIPASASGSLEIQDIVSVLKCLEVKLEDHWVIDAEFLGKLTKNEVDAVCSDLGIKTALGAGYTKLTSGKKEDLIKAAVSIDGFPYRGKIPRGMKWK